MSSFEIEREVPFSSNYEDSSSGTKKKLLPTTEKHRSPRPAGLTSLHLSQASDAFVDGEGDRQLRQDGAQTAMRKKKRQKFAAMKLLNASGSAASSMEVQDERMKSYKVVPC